MKSLSAEAFAQAKQYLYTYGREIDRRLFSYLFEDGPKSDVVEALKSYQNTDGGFGKALEPDIRADASSSIATQQALQFLRILDELEDPLIVELIQFLVDTFDTDHGVWPIIPPEVEQAPHAPWWSYSEAEANFSGFRANPTAALAGYLRSFGDQVPANILSAATDQVLDYLETISADEMGMHDFLCFAILAEALDGPRRSRLLDALASAIPHTVKGDPALWTGYALRPLQAVPSRDSLLAGFVPDDLVQTNLDYEIEEQLADGSWPLAWSWDFVDAVAWDQAEKEWKGYFVVNKLQVFRAFGRLQQ